MVKFLIKKYSFIKIKHLIVSLKFCRNFFGAYFWFILQFLLKIIHFFEIIDIELKMYVNFKINETKL